MEQQTSQTELFNKQVEEFVKAFPDVKAEEIPNEVWNDVADGIPLAYAYSYRITVKGDAEKSNEENDKKSIPISGERPEPLSYSKEDVEAMPSSKVKSNFKSIINSMKKWKF